MIVLQKLQSLFWLGLLLSLLSCSGENDVEDWTWGDDGVIGTGPFAGYHLGCSRLGKIEATPHRVQFSCGYRVTELPRRAKHLDGQNDIDDGPLKGFEFTGVVLLVRATQEQLDRNSPEPGEVTLLFISDVLRVAKTAAEIEKPEEVFFENVSLGVRNPECPGEFERCWREVNPSFVLCWDNPQTGRRAYQLLHPILYTDSSAVGSPVHPDCETFSHPALHFPLTQGLGVYWPLLDEYAQRMNTAPDFDRMDQVLPRPKPNAGGAN